MDADMRDLAASSRNFSKTSSPSSASASRPSKSPAKSPVMLADTKAVFASSRSLSTCSSSSASSVSRPNNIPSTSSPSASSLSSPNSVPAKSPVRLADRNAFFASSRRPSTSSSSPSNSTRSALVCDKALANLLSWNPSEEPNMMRAACARTRANSEPSSVPCCSAASISTWSRPSSTDSSTKDDAAATRKRYASGSSAPSVSLNGDIGGGLCFARASSGTTMRARAGTRGAGAASRGGADASFDASCASASLIART
mmetsp:Transcript_71275/g.231632  ORF Transcript_71275/g.231632 Transcript_71275/m.231632 type:complete len:257 (-) Transcript_71275:1459-2229(-)